MSLTVRVRAPSGQARIEVNPHDPVTQLFERVTDRFKVTVRCNFCAQPSLPLLPSISLHLTPFHSFPASIAYNHSPIFIAIHFEVHSLHPLPSSPFTPDRTEHHDHLFSCICQFFGQLVALLLV